MAQPLLNVTELDADQIKANLKAYFMRQDSPIKDWNFDGSGLNMLLDVLAYNTHYNAILAHLNLNESFIDTAQLRSSVISQAKLLGYIPKSITAATVSLSGAFQSSGAVITGATMTIPAGTKFTGTSPNGSFTFVTRGDAVAVATSTTSGYTISSFPLIQGVIRSQTYQVDNSFAGQKFIIDDPSADMSTLSVMIYANENSTTFTTFTAISSYIGNNSQDLANVTPSSKIYYLSLNSQGKYEVTFGDGILGQALNSLNVVKLSYYSTQGPLGNSITQFQFADTLIDGNGNPIASATVTALAPSTGGFDEESTESIRLNAPASLVTQKRAVTANDYITLLKDKYDIKTGAINVWGGEDEVVFDPLNAAQYAGKVFISFADSSTINNSDVLAYLKNYKVMSITPIIISPDYVYLNLNVNFKYNPNLTSKTSSQLVSNVNDNVIPSYNSSSLQSFTGVFRHSNLLRQIDTSDPSIINSDIQVLFYKTYLASPLSVSTDAVTKGVTSIPNGLVTTFGNKLYGALDQTASMITSSGFNIALSTMQNIMPAQRSVVLSSSTWTSASPSIITVQTSPGVASTQNTLTNPYLVVGAGVTASGYAVTTATITSINNTGSYSTITISPALTTSSASNATIYVTPPAGTYYLKDGDDPLSTTSRRLFMSPNSSSMASDPKYTPSGTDIHIGTVYPATGKLELYRYFTGNATAASTVTSLTVGSMSTYDGAYTTSINFLTNQLIGCVVYITAGAGYQQQAAITSNSSNTLYFSASSLIIAPDASTQFLVIRSVLDLTSASSIGIYSRPASNDVAPSRHQLLTIANSNVTATADTFAQSGVLGANNYTTFPRDP